MRRRPARLRSPRVSSSQAWSSAPRIFVARDQIGEGSPSQTLGALDLEETELENGGVFGVGVRPELDQPPLREAHFQQRGEAAAVVAHARAGMTAGQRDVPPARQPLQLPDQGREATRPRTSRRAANVPCLHQ